MAVGPQESTLAPRFTRVICVLVVIICVLTEVSLVVYGHLEPLARATPAVALVGYGAYVLFWAPLLRVSAAMVEIVNPLRTVRVTWSAIDDITTRWSLAFVTAKGTVTAWSVPAESPWASLGRLNRDVLGRPSLRREERTKRAGRPLSVPSIVTGQWENYRSSGLPKEQNTEWHRTTIIVLAALAVLTIVAIAVP